MLSGPGFVRLYGTSLVHEKVTVPVQTSVLHYLKFHPSCFEDGRLSNFVSQLIKSYGETEIGQAKQITCYDPLQLSYCLQAEICHHLPASASSLPSGQSRQ